MRTRSLATYLSLAAFLAIGGCAEPEVELESDIEAETEPGVPTTETDVQSPFGELDTDRSGYLTRDEWRAWWVEGDFAAEHDADGVEGLDVSEWVHHTLALWDTDDDDVLSEAEWTSGVERWYGEDVELGVWVDWDLDGDSELDADEVQEAFEREGLYDRVDGDHDALLDDEELADWFFDLFDADDDERLDWTEWDRRGDSRLDD